MSFFITKMSQNVWATIMPFGPAHFRHWELDCISRKYLDENFQAFANKFIEIIKNCVPQKKVTIRLNDKVWFRLKKGNKKTKLARKPNSDFKISYEIV